MRIGWFTIFRIYKYRNFIEFIILLYTFLVISFARYKEYIVWRISLNKFSDVLPAFICASTICNFWSIYLGVNILSCLRSAKIVSLPFPCVCFPFGNIPFSRSLITFCLPLRSIIAFVRVTSFFLFWLVL